MGSKSKTKASIISITAIRVEKESLKFPVHSLSKNKVLNITIQGVDRSGKEYSWKVSPNRDYGDPGELAYKLDTIVVNKRIQEAGKVKPRLIKLGTLRGICRELGLTEGAAGKVKAALMQNSFTSILAKISFKATDGSEYTIEKGFNRYAIIFYGQRLPDGRKADSVYLQLSDAYLELLNNSGTRPLNYDYLKELPPTAQRFYELVSPQIFATIKHNRTHAKYLYSEFCTFSALSRYQDGTQIRKQMYKILKPHKDSHYLQEVGFEEFINEQQELDCWLILTPGTKAILEFRQFFSQQNSQGDTEGGEALLSLPAPLPEPVTPVEERATVSSNKLAAALIELGIGEATASSLVALYPDRVEKWVEIVKDGYLPKTVQNAAAYIVKAISESYGYPKPFLKKQTPQRQKKLFPSQPTFTPKIISHPKTKSAREQLYEAANSDPQIRLFLDKALKEVEEEE